MTDGETIYQEALRAGAADDEAEVLRLLIDSKTLTHLLMFGVVGMLRARALR